MSNSFLYRFAHGMLREAFLSDPIGRIKEWNQIAGLLAFWRSKASFLPGKAPKPIGLAVHPLDIPECAGLIIELPTPAKPEPGVPPEAWFVALMVEKEQPRYLVLETAVPLSDFMNGEPIPDSLSHMNHGTMLCAWNGNVHQTLATGCKPTVQAFRELLIDSRNKKVAVWSSPTVMDTKPSKFEQN